MRDAEYTHMYEQEQTHWWYVGMREITRALLQPGAVLPGARALDAGCGTGFFLSWLRETYGVRTAGVDLYSAALAGSRRRGENGLAQGDMAALPFRSGAFDLVCSMDSLTHVHGDEARREAIGEFRRVLRPGGLLLLRAAAFEWLRTSHDDEIRTHHRYGGRELNAALSDAGFEILRWTFANSFLFPAAVAWRILKRAGVAPQGSDVRPFTRGLPWVNRTLRGVLAAEAALLGMPRLRFPFGLSFVVIARRRPITGMQR